MDIKLDIKYLLLDIDETITKSKSGAEFGQSPEDYQIIPDAKPAIAKFTQQSCLVAGISNQGGVAAGHKTLEESHKEQQFKMSLFPELAFILYCTDYAGNTCWMAWNNKVIACHEIEHYKKYKKSFRKPQGGMIKLALDEFGCTDKTQALYVGDRKEDMGAAMSSDVQFLLASEWRFRYR